jgi:hypothetical protein
MRLEPRPHLALETWRRFGHGLGVNELEHAAQLAVHGAAWLARLEMRAHLVALLGHAFAVVIEEQLLVGDVASLIVLAHVSPFGLGA